MKQRGTKEVEKRKSYNIDELHMFLQRAKAVNYSYLIRKFEKDAKLLRGEHNDVIFEERGFSLFDRYCLGNPFSGQEIVRFQNRPIWIMNYLGELVDKKSVLPNAVILELMKMALMAVYQAGGINGSIVFEKNGYRYLVENMTECSMYDGKGYIYQKDVLVYTYTYYGGIVSD